MTTKVRLTAKQREGLILLEQASDGLHLSNKTVPGSKLYHRTAQALIDAGLADGRGVTRITEEGRYWLADDRIGETNETSLDPVPSPAGEAAEGGEAEPATASPTSTAQEGTDPSAGIDPSGDGSSPSAPRARPPLGTGEEAEPASSPPQDRYGVGPVEPVAPFLDDDVLVATAAELVERASADHSGVLEVQLDGVWHELVGWTRYPADSPTVHITYGEVHAQQSIDLRADEEITVRVLDTGERMCRSCECTDDYACDGGCEWVEDDLCSTCADLGDDAEGFEDFAGRRVVGGTATLSGSMPVERPYERDDEVLLVVRARVGKVSHDMAKHPLPANYSLVAGSDVWELTAAALALLGLDAVTAPKQIVDAAREAAADAADRRAGRRKLPLPAGPAGMATVGGLARDLVDGLERDELLARDEDGRREFPEQATPEEVLDDLEELEAMAGDEPDGQHWEA